MSGRMLLLVLAGITMSGCNGLRDMLSARPEVAAEAKGQELKVERLAVLMTALKGVPLTREAAEFIASTWVDYTLFSQAVAAGRDLADSAIAAQVLWPELAEARGVRWHDSLLAHRAPLNPTLADSVYQADEVRVFQHILIRLPPNAEPPARQAAHKKAEQVYGRIVAGGNFAKLAGQFSDDPGSKVDGGYLPPAPRGKWVTAFDSAGWTLSPGGMTNVVESPFGFHIIRRPPAAEIRDRLLAFTRQQVGMKIDSMYLDSLGIRKHLKVAGDAPSTMRKAMADRDNSLNSATAIATYDGGSLTVADLMRWMTAGGPTWSSDLAARPDSVLTRFAKLIGQNKLLLAEADSAGVRVSPDEWASNGAAVSRSAGYASHDARYRRRRDRRSRDVRSRSGESRGRQARRVLGPPRRWAFPSASHPWPALGHVARRGWLPRELGGDGSRARLGARPQSQGGLRGQGPAAGATTGSRCSTNPAGAGRAVTMKFRGLLLLAGWLGFGAPTLVAQADAGPPDAPSFHCDTAATVDRVVAVVGDAPILASQVEEEIFTQRAQQGALPKTLPEFRVLCREVVSDLIDAEVMVQVAQRDTAIKVTDQEIADGVDQQFKNVRQRFTSEIDFRAELAKSGFQTPEEFRRYLTEIQRKAALRNRLIEKLKNDGKLKPVQPTDKEMRTYFDQYQDQLPQRPATVSFRNIVIAAKPSARGAGTGAEAGGLHRGRTPQGRRFRDRGEAVLPGSGEQGTGWGPWLVPPGADGPGV